MEKYTVKKGDNLSSIAKKNGLTLNQLMKLNPQIKNSNLIGIGDTITLSNSSSKANDVANYSYGQFQPEIPTDETTSWGRNRKLNYQRNQMMNKELDKSKKLLKEGAEQGKKDKAKLIKRQTQQMRGRSPEYLITTKRQQALKPYGYTGEIDGIWGRGSEMAYKKAKEAGYDFDNNGNLVKTIPPATNNTLYGLAVGAIDGKIYPYDYNPSVSFDDNNVKSYYEFLDLDLNTPEGLNKAKEIRLRKQEDGKPVFSNRSTQDNVLLQNQFRQRYDLMQLSQGKDQKYNNFKPITGPDGSTMYEFTDDNINKAYLRRAIAAKQKYGMSDQGYVTATKNGKKYVPVDETQYLMNQYQIRGGSENNRDWTHVYDLWDIAPLKFLGENNAPKIYIRRYDDEISGKDVPSEMVIPNSVYYGNSVKISENEPLREGGYSSPLSIKYFKDVIKHNVTSGIKNIFGIE